MPLSLFIVILFPIWHYAVSVLFVLPKFLTWKKLDHANVSFRHFTSRVLWHNEPPHRLSGMTGTLKQLISFAGAAFFLFHTSGIYISF
jgi:hypothetical protein